jgi:ribosomal protein S18 acetylase RimI-like enzyme
MFKTEKLTQEEIQIIQDFIYKTPNIIYYCKKELTKLTAIKLYLNQEFAGFCVLKDIGWSGKYSEIAVLGVLDKFQGQGFGKQLFELGLKVLKGKKVYCVSKNPKVIRLMKQNNFVECDLFGLPLEVNLDNLGYACNFKRLREAFRKRSNSRFCYTIKD